MNTVVQILDNLEDAARADRTDGQLLDLFVRLRDADAFAAVVRRHGPMVLAVCRRVLHNSADADDAFQAAFLVLARKAATLGSRHLLAQWLYGVAYNTARKLRHANTRRAARERPLESAPEPHAPATDARDELLAVLDDELNQLPDRYRAVIVLCDLEGLTRREAAARLACPEGTVAGRLARAGDLLAARLARRGVVPAAGLLVAVLTGRRDRAPAGGRRHRGSRGRRGRPRTRDREGADLAPRGRHNRRGLEKHVRNQAPNDRRDRVVPRDRARVRRRRDPLR